jgi:hypothetical protein
MQMLQTINKDIGIRPGSLPVDVSFRDGTLSAVGCLPSGTFCMLIAKSVSKNLPYRYLL